MFTIISAFWLVITASFAYETTLNGQRTSQDGAIIYHNSQSVITYGPNFEIDVQAQDAYDLKLSLNESWGFHPSITSTITVTLNGYTYDPNADTDILIVFTVGNKQYFSFLLHLDNRRTKSQIFPSTTVTNTTPNVNTWISDTTIPQRWHRISNNNQWIPLDWNNQCLWPLQFTITNHPNQHNSVFAFYHDATSQFAARYIFDDSFTPNQPIDMYIMGNSFRERLAISSVHISINSIISYSPSAQPTINPLSLTDNQSTDSVWKTMKNNLWYSVSVALCAAVFMSLIICFVCIRQRKKRKALSNKRVTNENRTIKRGQVIYDEIKLSESKSVITKEYDVIEIKAGKLGEQGESKEDKQKEEVVEKKMEEQEKEEKMPSVSSLNTYCLPMETVYSDDEYSFNKTVTYEKKKYKMNGNKKHHE